MEESDALSSSSTIARCTVGAATVPTPASPIMFANGRSSSESSTIAFPLLLSLLLLLLLVTVLGCSCLSLLSLDILDFAAASGRSAIVSVSTTFPPTFTMVTQSTRKRSSPTPPFSAVRFHLVSLRSGYLRLWRLPVAPHVVFVPTSLQCSSNKNVPQPPQCRGGWSVSEPPPPPCLLTTSGKTTWNTPAPSMWWYATSSFPIAASASRVGGYDTTAETPRATAMRHVPRPSISGEVTTPDITWDGLFVGNVTKQACTRTVHFTLPLRIGAASFLSLSIARTSRTSMTRRPLMCVYSSERMISSERMDSHVRIVVVVSSSAVA
eukprot:PhM_4_TR268/c0_g1_i1/m.1602